jgi:hypothetical protein
MGYAIINPLACVNFGGTKSGNKKGAAKKPEQAPVLVATTTEATEGNQNAVAASTVGPKRAASTKSGKKSAAKKPEPAPVPAATTEATTEGNQTVSAAPTVVRPKQAAGKRRKAEAAPAPYRGGFLPYRPLWSYNIDPVANCMYFYGGVGQILC